MNDIIWKEWVRNWNWILDIAKKRNWDNKKLVIKSPINIAQIEEIENEFNFSYPTEFKTVLAKYSSGILFNWQIEHEETEGEFSEIFCGGGRGYLWDFETLRTDYSNYLGSVNEAFPNPDDVYDRVWHNKIPFLDVPNGDVIAFEKENGSVIYLSHDGSDFHGHRLAESFIEFISRWSNIGCVGTEDWQYEPFYDYEKMTIRDKGELIDRWKQWLEKSPS